MRETETVPMPVTLAEWVNADRCPMAALYAAGRLFVELRQRTPEDSELAARLAALRTKLGTDVRWAGAEEYRALARIAVDADRIVCQWRPWLKLEGPAHPTDLTDMANWWNSMPLAERPIEVDWDDIPSVDRKYDSSLDTLIAQWYATPEPERPKRFPLDPVVQAWMESRAPNSPVPNAAGRPAGEILLQDYMPDWQRHRQDVRHALENDAEKNVEDAHTAFERAQRRVKHHGELRRENPVDLLIGLLRAADCELHPRNCPAEERATEAIKMLIDRLGRLRDIDHGRAGRAFDYALGGGRRYGELRNMYRKRRTAADGDGLTLPSAVR